MKRKLICIALSSAMAVSSFGLAYANENVAKNSVIQEQEIVSSSGIASNEVVKTGQCGEMLHTVLIAMVCLL
jgi:uncharacterized low-complexity protein